MADKFMYIPNDDDTQKDTPSVDYNQWLKVETFGWTLNLMNQPTKIQ